MPVLPALTKTSLVRLSYSSFWVKILPSNCKLLSAFALEPSISVIILLSPELVKLITPDVPELPELPEVPGSPGAPGIPGSWILVNSKISLSSTSPSTLIL